jgi:hypothetical protein
MLELGASVALHTALGLALAALVWVAGLGVLALLRRGEPLDAYPLGLLAVMAAAVPPLLQPWLALPSLAFVGALVLAGTRRVAFRLSAPLVLATVGSFGFGAGLGALLHGPTDEFGSAAYGGMLFYVDKVVAATQSIAPFHDLLVEGVRIIYLEAGTSFVGAVLSALPGFDAVLFNAATLPTFAIASLALGFASLSWAPPRDGLTAASVALLALAIVTYPTWVTETPPAAFALPLAFSVYRIWRDDLDTVWFVVLGGVVAVDYLATKVLGVVPLGVLFLAALVRRLHGRPDFRRLLVLGAGGLAAAAAVMVAVLFLTAGWYATLLDPKALPLDVARAFANGDTDPNTLGLAAAVAGELLLIVVLARARWWSLLAAVGLVVPVVWFVAGYAFDIALGTAIFVVALELWRRGGLERRLAFAAALLLGVSVAFRDVLGARPGLVLTLLAAVAVAPFVVRGRRELLEVALAAGGACLLALADLALLGLVLLVLVAAAGRFRRPAVVGVAAAGAAAAVVTLATGSFDVGSRTITLTPDDHDIWAEVRERVPVDGLVFTTLTGREVTPLRGWNNYPSVAERQLYLAGWYDGRLVSDPDERDRRLALNREVLTGERRPESVGLTRDYGSYYAVARVEETVPRSFARVYANERYALYEIP